MLATKGNRVRRLLTVAAVTEIGGQRLTDYWFYVHRRCVFDLVLSNPDSVRLYRMTPQQYAAATGCAHG